MKNYFTKCNNVYFTFIFIYYLYSVLCAIGKKNIDSTIQEKNISYMNVHQSIDDLTICRFFFYYYYLICTLQFVQLDIW